MQVGKYMILIDRSRSDKNPQLVTVSVTKVGRKYLTLSNGDRAHLDDLRVVREGLRIGRVYHSLEQYHEDVSGAAMWEKVVHQIKYMDRPSGRIIREIAAMVGVTVDEPKPTAVAQPTSQARNRRGAR